MVLMKSTPWNEPGSQGSDEVEWNMWQVRQSPYLDLKEGDRYFTVSGGTVVDGTIIAEVQIQHLIKAPYASHEEAWELVRTGIPEGDRATQNLADKERFLDHDYTLLKPNAGHLLAYVARHVRNINKPRPDGFRFRPNGWGRYDNPSW